mgnify:CR=1 FL=1
MQNHTFNVTPAYDDNGIPNFLDDSGELVEGIYSGLENKKYHALPALSSSALKTFSVSPAHYFRSYLSDVDRKRSIAQERTFETGDLSHRLVLEPDGFYDEFAQELNPLDHPKALKTISDLTEKCCELGLKKSGKKSELIDRLIDHQPNLALSIWECISRVHINKNIGKSLVDPIVWEDAHRCVATTRANPLANELLTEGFPELTVLAKCQNTGLWLKARPDWLRFDEVVVDYKTTRNASPRGFAKQAKELNYALQQEFYVYVLSLVGIVVKGFHFVANEYIQADITECYTLDGEWIGTARTEMNSLITEFDQCKTNDTWYGYDGNNTLKEIREPWYTKPRTPLS